MISPSAMLLQWGRCPQFVCGFLAASVLLTAGLPVLVQLPVRSQSFEVPLSFIQQAASPTLPAVVAAHKNQTAQSQDPFNSAFPVPWNVIWENQTKASRAGKVLTLQSVSDIVQSPDGQRQAYSEINLYLHPELTQSYISSILIITDVKGNVLQNVPSSIHLGHDQVKETSRIPVGTLSILMPADWSKDSQQLLARQFEAVLGSDVSSDYALVWNRQTQQVKTVAPEPQDYDSAILLGWNPQNPEQILFRTAILGEQKTNLVAIGRDGNTIASQKSQVPAVARDMSLPASRVRR
jgi:hypothetical protein